MGGFRDDEQMDECNAALVLMSLSGSPHSPRQWMFGSSPGSSSASWTSGSDELSDEGIAHHHSTNTTTATANMNIQTQIIGSTTGNGNGTNYNNQYFNTSNNNNNNNNHHNTHQSSSNNRLRTASLSTSDEGIVMDYNDETPRKRRVSRFISILFLWFEWEEIMCLQFYTCSPRSAATKSIKLFYRCFGLRK